MGINKKIIFGLFALSQVHAAKETTVDFTNDNVHVAMQPGDTEKEDGHTNPNQREEVTPLHLIPTDSKALKPNPKCTLKPLSQLLAEAKQKNAETADS